MTILANDGMSNEGINLLERSGHVVITTKVAQDQLATYINENNVEALIVRSATTARKDLIDACPNLKVIGRGGVGMDNIDVKYANSKGIHVFNTPASSSDSVAELVFAHISGMLRFLHDSNGRLTDENFNDLKKAYSKGSEMRGKNIGIIGFGRIGKAVAKVAYGVGMNVIAHDPWADNGVFEVTFADGQSIKTTAQMVSLEELLQFSDIVTIHIAGRDEIIGTEEIATMPKGSYIVNAARGGVVNESALLEAVENGHLAGAALDVFVNEPNPNPELLFNLKFSVTPHIGAATVEAQDRIGVELANGINDFLKKEILV